MMTRNEQVLLILIDHPLHHYTLGAVGDIVYLTCYTCNKTYRGEKDLSTKAVPKE